MRKFFTFFLFLFFIFGLGWARPQKAWAYQCNVGGWGRCGCTACPGWACGCSDQSLCAQSNFSDPNDCLADSCTGGAGNTNNVCMSGAATREMHVTGMPDNRSIWISPDQNAANFGCTTRAADGINYTDCYCSGTAATCNFIISGMEKNGGSGQSGALSNNGSNVSIILQSGGDHPPVNWIKGVYSSSVTCGQNAQYDLRGDCNGDGTNWACSFGASGGYEDLIVHGPTCPLPPPTCSVSGSTNPAPNTPTSYTISQTNAAGLGLYSSLQSNINGWTTACENKTNLSCSPQSISLAAGSYWVVCNGFNGAPPQCTGNPWCNFNGANSCVASSRSVNAWIKTNNGTNGGRNQQIYSSTDGNNANGWQIYISGTGYANMWLGGNIYNISPKFVADNAWHMITGVLDGTNAWLYVDNSSPPVNTTARPGSPTKDNQIGAECSGTGSTTCDSYFNGTIDEVGVWGRNLYPSDVSSLYNSGTGRSLSLLSIVPGVNTNSGNSVPISQFLISYWPLDGSTSDSVDSNNGTGVNTGVNTTGKIGSASTFNGSSSLIKISTPANINTTGCTSCSGWTDCGASSRLPVSVTAPTHSECVSGACTAGIAGASQAGDCTSSTQCQHNACSGISCASNNWTGRGTDPTASTCTSNANCLPPWWQVSMGDVFGSNVVSQIPATCTTNCYIDLAN